MRKLYRLLIAATIGFLIGTIFITEGGLHIYDRRIPHSDDAEAVAQETLSAWEPARIAARDGTPLDAWLFRPRRPNGGAVILLHGVGDSREGMLGHARLLLGAGYTVLLPDFRGHGTSGGTLITYGIRESVDIHQWCDWLLARYPTFRLYGLGRSMGSAILIEALPREPRFRAVIAECPFSTFEDIAYYRLGRQSHLGNAELWPIVHVGFAYARLVHGIDLFAASPAAAIRSTSTPVLLIHGASDTNIPASESEVLHRLNPAATTLWLVPGAEHLNAMDVAPEKYRETVLSWLQSHP